MSRSSHTIIFAWCILALHLLGNSCGPNPKSGFDTNIADTLAGPLANKVELQDALNCEDCNNIYTNFPQTKSEFNELYGFSDSYRGSRYGREEEDFSKLESCLRKCFDLNAYTDALLLGSAIDYTADGPAILQYYLTNFSMDNQKVFVDVQEQMSTQEKVRIVEFFLEGIPSHDKFRETICSFLVENYSGLEMSKFIIKRCPPAQ